MTFKNLLEIIRNLIASRVPSGDKLYGKTGVINDTPDYRDISLASIQAITLTPASYDGLEDVLKLLPVFNQGNTGSCVPHAISMLMMAYIYRKTNTIVNINPRIGYRFCKLLDGLPESGTYPRVGGKVFTKYGCGTTEVLPDENKDDDIYYLDFDITDTILDSCKENKLPGFAYVANNIEAIKQAIFNNGAIVGNTKIGNWNNLPLTLSFNGTGHYTVWYKYETLPDGDTKIFIKNSWSSKWLSWLPNWASPGYGYFLWSKVNGNVNSIIAFTDISKDYLDNIKKMPYRFTRDLKVGSEGIDVKELQKLLNESPETTVSPEGAGSPGQETTSFGLKTREALQKWQIKHNIPSTGYFGTKSRAKANENIGDMNRIRDWALAIQTHEGYFAGSRSFRNHNPGNIRYTGIYAPMAIGKDDKGFCIFKTYEEGLNALEILLIRAAKGLSSVYKPEDTLLQFYQKYAPSNDGNNPATYANAVAKALGVPVETQIKNLI